MSKFKFFILFFLSSQFVYSVYDTKLNPQADKSFSQKSHAQKINEKFINNPDSKEWDDNFSKASRDVIEHKAQIINAMNIQPSDHLADIGAGTGSFISDFLSKVPNGKVYAVEVSQSFIDFLKQKNITQWSQKVSIVKGEMNSTTLADNSIDIIYLCDVFHHLENIPLMLSDFSRVLKKGGRVIIVDFDRFNEKAIPFVLEHQPFSKKDHIKFMQDNGFEFTSEKQLGMRLNFFLEFIKN